MYSRSRYFALVGMLTARSEGAEFFRGTLGSGSNGTLFNCDVGCPMEERQLVCADGITFQNRCLAVCQGMNSIEDGPCEDSDDAWGSWFGFPGLTTISEESALQPEAESALHVAAATPPISKATMSRYEEDGFICIGALKFEGKPTERDLNPEYNAELDDKGKPLQLEADELSTSVTALRVSYDGHAYFSRYTVERGDRPCKTADKRNGKKAEKHKEKPKKGKCKPENERIHSEKPQSKPKKEGKPEKKKPKGKKIKQEKASKSSKVKHQNESDSLKGFIRRGKHKNKIHDRRRRATVIGDIDSRTAIDNTSTSPYKRIGEIDYEGSEGGCSGAVIGKNSFATAAHCVFSLSQKSWFPVRYFAPGRPKTGQLQQDGYKWRARDATIYRTWVESGKIEYDIAVVRVYENDKGSIGDAVGRFNLYSYTCAVDPESEVTGYPADKTGDFDGRQFRSGMCDNWAHACDSKRVYHQCDTAGGNSGSPIYDSIDDLIGIHTHGAGNSNWNSGVAFDYQHESNLRRWSD